MNEKILEALHEVYSYAGHIDDWIVIKKEMLKCLPVEERKAFSTRDPITKRQRTNEFERVIAQKWQELTQRNVIFKDDEKAK
jgi:hypothetical protein